MSTHALAADEPLQPAARRSEHETRDMVNAGMVAIMKFFSKLTKAQRAILQKEGVELPFPLSAGVLQELITP